MSETILPFDAVYISSGLNFNQPLVRLGLIKVLNHICPNSRVDDIVYLVTITLQKVNNQEGKYVGNINLD